MELNGSQALRYVKCPLVMVSQNVHSIQLNSRLRAGAINLNLTISETSTAKSLFLNKGETDDEEW